MSDVSSKRRILKIKEILERDTDEFHKLSLGDIIEKLRNEFQLETDFTDFKIDKRSIKEDLAELDESGFSVNQETGKNSIGLYYHHERLFEIHELRLLIDAVSSARFITPSETENIISKLKSLTSINLAKKLNLRVHLDNMIKSENKQLKYYLYTIHEAISENRKLSFKYGRYNVDKEFILSHNGASHVIDPYALVWSNDFYYLVSKNEENDSLINYRVDRMVDVIDTEENFVKDDFNVTEHLRRCFNMYPGEVDIVEIKFRKNLINAIIDKLGKDMDSKKIDEESFIVKFHAAINEGLLRWVLMWGADAKVLGPDKLLSMMEKECAKMVTYYKKT